MINFYDVPQVKERMLDLFIENQELKRDVDYYRKGYFEKLGECKDKDTQINDLRAVRSGVKNEGKEGSE